MTSRHAPTGARVLVVDDEPLVGRALQRILQPNHVVATECDPNRAITRVLSGERFDLILCDLHMPSLRGEAVLDAIAGLPPDARPCFTYLTGGIFEPGDREALEAAPGGYLSKPFDVTQVRELAECAAKRARSRAAR